MKNMETYHEKTKSLSKILKILSGSAVPIVLQVKLVELFVMNYQLSVRKAGDFPFWVLGSVK